MKAGINMLYPCNCLCELKSTELSRPFKFSCSASLDISVTEVALVD